MTIMEGYHKPVLLKEAIEALDIWDDGWYLDCTLGDGGHTIEILRKGGKVVGLDVDPQAISRAQIRLESLGIDKIRYKLVQGNFRELKNLIEKPASTAKRGEQADTERLKFAGAIFDLGVSSMQLEAPERGFSFTKVGPLDMRMDPNLAVRALDLINVLSRKELYELFFNLGEEKNSWALADALVRARQIEKITTTRQLAEIVERVAGKKERIPASHRRAGASRGGHPATRIFQALRIAVNDEINTLKEGLSQVVHLIEKNGRIVVISFHSLEDRVVKNTFKDWEAESFGRRLTEKPARVSPEEIRLNPRSRSAKMRVFQTL